MNNRGIDINFYLMDGQADGRIECSLHSTDILVYKIPKEKLNEEANEAMHHAGVYFLIGDNSIYVGRAMTRKSETGLIHRATRHTDKEWDEIFLFTKKNNTLTSTDLDFLENTFYNMAKDAGKYEVINRSEPPCGNLTEVDKRRLNLDIEYFKMIFEVLGYKAFEKVEQEVVVKGDFNLEFWEGFNEFAKQDKEFMENFNLRTPSDTNNLSYGTGIVGCKMKMVISKKNEEARIEVSGNERLYTVLETAGVDGKVIKDRFVVRKDVTDWEEVKKFFVEGFKEYKKILKDR